jgi:hypothetical protein
MIKIRIGGRIHKLDYNQVSRTGYGIIQGDDGHHYMFLPSYLRLPPLMPQLTLGSLVTFDPRTTDRGMRARNITVISITAESPDGSAHQIAL